jgi:hypothetical protein
MTADESTKVMKLPLRGRKRGRIDAVESQVRAAKAPFAIVLQLV